MTSLKKITENNCFPKNLHLLNCTFEKTIEEFLVDLILFLIFQATDIAKAMTWSYHISLFLSPLHTDYIPSLFLAIWKIQCRSCSCNCILPQGMTGKTSLSISTSLCSRGHDAHVLSHKAMGFISTTHCLSMIHIRFFFFNSR